MAAMISRMRTIEGAIREIKATDPETELKSWALRQLIKSGKFKGFVMVGSKYLINMSALEDYLRNPPEEAEEPFQYGQLRQVKS